MGMTNKHKTKAKQMTAMAAILLASACASGGGVVDANGFTALNESPVPPSNENITALSASNPNRGRAVSQTFQVASAFQTTRVNSVGSEEVIARSRSDFREPGGSVFFDAANSTLTFDISQGVVDINDSFGLLLLAEPGDFLGIDNDRLAITISAIPEEFPALPSGLLLPGNATSFSDLQGNPEAVDAFITDLGRIASGEASVFGSTISSEGASLFLNTLTELTDFAFSFDYVRHTGSEGAIFDVQDTVSNNSGVSTNYVTLGLWRTAPVAGLPGDVTEGASVFGVFTPVDEVPITGTATYDTVIGGTVLRNGVSEFLTGSVNITANFDTRILDFGIQSILQDFDAAGNTIFTDFVELEGEGLITGGNQFDGDLRGVTDPSLRGEVAGAFFGPDAVEVGGTFRFGNDTIEASGGFVGVNPESDATN